MTRTALLIIVASALSATAVAQTTQPSQQKQSTQRQAAAGQPAKDPSSQKGRPQASYPNPSGQDTKDDAAARQRTEQGHDDPSDANKVKPTPSAGPTGGQDTYAGATGKKAAPQSECDQAKNSQKNTNASNSGAQSQSEKCVGAQASDDKADRRATAPPPGATAPIHPK